MPTEIELHNEFREHRRIVWSYTHKFGKAHIVKVKHGEYVGLVKHTIKHWGKRGSRQMCVVHFDGNAHVSIVPIHELRKENTIHATQT